jgi:hypothetical protein
MMQMMLGGGAQMMLGGGAQMMLPQMLAAQQGGQF